ncbi:hypothetical protein AV530_012127 [Patagioenas fasciata monilis]|uniref:Uncharacterized protein n=1 Tax=Patagioenas fasciata monilis TaxID=372326 RepID=A0A1V4JUZ4_PATFA|nr:hypothetical protein AV530_012127 [Patagioenas fasciata monilis]
MEIHLLKGELAAKPILSCVSCVSSEDGIIANAPLTLRYLNSLPSNVKKPSWVCDEGGDTEMIETVGTHHQCFEPSGLMGTVNRTACHVIQVLKIQLQWSR